jgi:catechol 2,3-dioxygenase-like lactoylglutathione lyase family enzyme
MKRFHLHLRVFDIDSSVDFYSSLFGVPPARRDQEHAHWVLEDPRLTLTMTAADPRPGLEHVGIHVDTDDELEAVRLQFVQLDACGHDAVPGEARDEMSSEHWLVDPQGILWQARRAEEEVA